MALEVVPGPAPNLVLHSYLEVSTVSSFSKPDKPTLETRGGLFTLRILGSWGGGGGAAAADETSLQKQLAAVNHQRWISL